MSSFKVFLDYLVYLNLVVAIAAYTLAAGVTNIFEIDNSTEYGLFGFFATFCVYNGQRLFKFDKESNSPRLKWMFAHRKLVFASSSASLILTVHYFIKLIQGINVAVIVLMCIATLISFFYVMRIGKRNLRNISYVKTHSIALTWTIVILLFPVVNENIPLSQSLLYFIPAHYLYFLAVAASFDIKDLKVDPSTQRTIPQIVGFHHTKVVAIILLMISTIAISYYLYDYFTLIALITQIVLIGAITDKRKDIYFNIFIDGAISLLGITYMIV